MREFILYSIVSILTVLGLVAAVNFFGQGRDNQNLTAETANMVALVQNIQGVYTGNSDFTGIGAGPNGGNLITGGIAPAGMISGTGSTAALKNGWGGAVTVAGNAAVSNSTFLVTEPGIPQSVCAKFATAFASGGLLSLKINTTQVPAPITAANAITACNASTNTLQFESGH